MLDLILLLIFFYSQNLAKSSLMDYWHLNNITKLEILFFFKNIGLECGKRVI
jgi:hypothetical protein